MCLGSGEECLDLTISQYCLR